jgi:DNA-binding response OmpR family regulator
MIIVLTGLGSASVRQEAYSSGADLVLVKPVKLGELGAILDTTHTNMNKG